MADIIYAKYNKLRQKAFRICTVVCEENGERFVEKRPLCPEAEEHVNRMAEVGDRFKEMYPKIDFVPAYKTETGVRFDYVSGQTVDSLLTQKVKTAEELHKAFEELFKWLLPTIDKRKPFELTPEFKKVFGPGSLMGGSAAFGANVDCNLDNFVVENGRIVCLDYEWVFECDIPIDFLMYRVIHYYYGAHPETSRIMKEDHLLREIGIPREIRSRYVEMEEYFQQYVFGGEKNIRYTDNYRQPVVDAVGLIESQKNEIDELSKVVGHYQQVEGKLRKVGVWQLMQKIQKIGRDIKGFLS